jgi:hypothetical protein
MNFFYRPTEILTRVAAVENSSEDIMDIIRRILDEMNERASIKLIHDSLFILICL